MICLSVTEVYTRVSLESSDTETEHVIVEFDVPLMSRLLEATKGLG